MPCTIASVTTYGAFAARTRTRSDDEVGLSEVPGQVVWRGLEEAQIGRNVPPELVRSSTISPTDKDLRAHAVRGSGSMPPHHPITNDHDGAVACAQNGAELHAFAVVEPGQIVASDGHGHIAGNGAHGRQKRQPTVRIFYRLVGDGGGLPPEQSFRQWLFGAPARCKYVKSMCCWR